MLVKRSLKKQLYLLVAAFLFTIVFTGVWNASTIIEPQPAVSFVMLTEMLIPILAMIPVSFMLSDPYEIELGLVSGVRTTKLVWSKLVPVLVYILSAVYVSIILSSYTPYIPSAMTKVLYPVYVPENYKLCLLISETVTILFFISALLFARVLTKNCYVPVGLGLFIWYTFKEYNEAISTGSKPLKNAITDLFISKDFIGNTVFNIYGENNLWTYNRLIFAGITVVLFALSYFIIRREKLHETSGD